jgi:hypothetical protein
MAPTTFDLLDAAQEYYEASQSLATRLLELRDTATPSYWAQNDYDRRTRAMERFTSVLEAIIDARIAETPR